jgi:hypothetical protein
MEKMNCFDLSLKLSFVEEITYNLWTHEKATGKETLKTIITTQSSGDYASKDYSVIMVEATSKNHFTIYGYREV